MNNESVSRLLDQLESRARIREIASSYCIAADDRDMDALSALFTDDIHIESQDGAMAARGRANVLSMFDRLFEIRGPSCHWTHDVIIEFEASDPDRARGLVLAHAETTPNGIACIAALRYRDAYRREGGKWLFAERLLSFLYYMPVTEFAARFPTPHRIGIHGGWSEADYPEALPSWQAWPARKAARDHGNAS